jgi:hypothetical protein
MWTATVTASAAMAARPIRKVMCQWRRISALLDEKGPFIYAVTRTTMRALDLSAL